MSEKTNGRDNGLLGLGWGGLDVPRLPAFLRGVHGAALETKASERPDPLAGYTAMLREAAKGDDLAAKIARALLEPAPVAKDAKGGLARRIGRELASGGKTKDARSRLARRIGRLLAG